MAMNNWGGVREHMTKKPRQVFGRKIANKSSGNNDIKPLPKDKLRKADRKRRSTIRREVIVYLLIIFLVSSAMIWYVL